MKKILLLLLCLRVFSTIAQEAYVSEKNIHYYAGAEEKKDSYLAYQCVLDIYYPKNVKNFATIVWFHGGGLTSGAKEIPKALMDKGCAVIGVSYRHSPKAKAPAYIEDAAAAVAWAFNKIKDYGGSDKLIFVSGHSAGGYLAMMITLETKWLNKYGIDANRIAAVVPFSGQAITHFTVRQESAIRDTQPIIDQYAPLYHVRGDSPPMLLITGDAELELLGRFEENSYLHRMMKLNGHKDTRLIQLQGYDHGGMAEPAFPLLLKEVSRVKAGILN